MKHVPVAALVVLAALASFVPRTASAVSLTECSIWICLPGGFPAGCEAAYAAMLARLKRFQPPLPAWSSCAVKVGGDADTDLRARFGADPFFPCREGYTMRIDRDRGNIQGAQCISDAGKLAREQEWIPDDIYDAERRPNGGRYVLMFDTDGSPITPIAEDGSPLADPRFFY